MKGIACAIALFILAVCASAQFALGDPVTHRLGKEDRDVGKLYTQGAMTIIPILTTEKPNAGKYITLAEATKRGLVEIVEVPGREQVNELEVRNKADLPLMLVAGELLIGGKQDRIVAKDFIVPAHESALVPVFCVEHGRWQPGAKEFRGGDIFVPDQVRTAANQSLMRGGGGMAAQGQVWDQVAKVNQKAQKDPGTGTVRGTLDDPNIRAKIDQITDKLDRSVENSSRVVGMMVWMGGKILSADIFANHAMFDESRLKLLRSYAVDLILAGDTKYVPVDLAACKKFLSQIANAKRELAEKGGSHNLYQITGSITGYESGGAGFGGGSGGAARSGFGHGTYKPGGKG